MQDNWFFNEVEQQAALFEPISLAEMDSVKLMDRTDTKYLIPLALFPCILQDLLGQYRVLSINETRLCRYQTLYYDTTDLRLYLAHQAGKLNRVKVRARTYVESDLHFLEVKRKNNRGRTVKNRIPWSRINSTLDAESQQFVGSCGALTSTSIEGRLWVDYTRMTLVSATSAERLTVDFNLTFRTGAEKKNYPELVIAELKQERAQASPFRGLMKKYGIRKGSISKYCFGVTCLYPTVKQNNFKRHWQSIRKTQRQHDFIAASSYNGANRALVAV